MAKWKKYKPDGIVRILEKERSINQEGKVQFQGMSMMTAPTKLAAMLNFNREFTLEDGLGIVRQSIFAAAKNKLTPDSILEEVKRQEIKLLSVKEDSYVFVASLSISRSRHDLPSLQINNCRITFTKSLPKKFTDAFNNSKSIQNFLASENGYSKDYTTARVSVRAKGLNRATEKALDALNLFRGLMNFRINFGQTTISFGGGPRKPINKVLLGLIYTLHEPDGRLAASDLFWYNEEFWKPITSYSNIYEGRFNKWLEGIKKIRRIINKSKIRKELVNAILLYNEALDCFNYEVSYIKLWAVLELLTAKNPDEAQITVVKRAAFIFDNRIEVENDLNMIKDFRNNLTHKGFMNANIELFVYKLKVYVEYLINFLIHNSSHFNCYDDVKLFLDCPRNNEELERKSRLMKFAQHMNPKE